MERCYNFLAEDYGQYSYILRKAAFKLSAITASKSSMYTKKITTEIQTIIKSKDKKGLKKVEPLFELMVPFLTDINDVFSVLSNFNELVEPAAGKYENVFITTLVRAILRCVMKNPQAFAQFLEAKQDAPVQLLNTLIERNWTGQKEYLEYPARMALLLLQPQTMQQSGDDWFTA